MVPFSTRGSADEADSTWPLAIRGTQIGRLPNVTEVTIQTRPDVLIWAFSSSAQCQTWRLRNYNDLVVRTKDYVCRRGVVHHAYSVDASGDVIMKDASSGEQAGDCLG